MQVVYLLSAIIVFFLITIGVCVYFMLTKTVVIIEKFLKHIDNLELKVKSETVYQYNQVDVARKAKHQEELIKKQVQESIEKHEGTKNDELPDLDQLASDPMKQMKFIKNFQGIVEE